MQKIDKNILADAPYSLRKPQNIGALLVFVLIVFAGGSVIGVAAMPGEWYAGLIKPAFNPPNWIFGPVWSVLYVAIAVAGWRSWQRNRAGRAMKIWIVQMIANFAWSPAFFVAQRVDLAFAVIIFVFVSILAFIAVTWRKDRLSALLFVPYALWVGFASTLNGAILFLN